jgi:hypothetical protein
MEMDRATFEKCQDRQVDLKCPECGASCALRVSDAQVAGLQAA